MKKNRDVKFIIYQSLYIFVVCVIAIKGANLDLAQVVEDDGTIRAEITPDSLQKLLDVLAVSLIVDTNVYVIISKVDLEKNIKLAELYKSLPPIVSIEGMVRLNPGERITTLTPEELKKIEEIKKEPSEVKEIKLKGITLTQYTENILNNPYDQPLEIVGITTIPPKSTKSFVTGGQSSVVIKVGNSTTTVELKPNEKPKIGFQRISSMGEETRVTSLQSSVCYRVTISDDFPGQLEVKFSGPVSVKQSGNAYDVTLNAFTSKGAFDNYTDNKDSPYSLGFTVTVKDKIAGHSITGQNTFIFGEW